MRTISVIALTILAFSSPALAKVASVEFTNLVNGCELIVVAQVESISSPLQGVRYAKARVTEVWKGAKTDTVEFLPSPTWTCDIADAKVGETVVLFLIRSDKSRSYAIAHSGRGRMPVHTISGRNYAALWDEVLLPKGTPTTDGPEPNGGWIRSVEVSTLREVVDRAPQNEDATKQ